jgi:hypothetical protein
MRLSREPTSVDVQKVEPTRDERRLGEVRSKIDVLHVRSTDEFNLPARYRALVTLETILAERVRAATRSRPRSDSR